MGKITVNYNHFETAAKEIESYIKLQKSEMEKATQEVITLGTVWQGKDYNQFYKQWNELDDSDSTTVSYQKSLQSYADLLRYTASEYKKAQEKAIDLANKI
ncbi:hypothetical protein SFC08_10470 [Lysinibacillus halotolerans]